MGISQDPSSRAKHDRRPNFGSCAVPNIASSRTSSGGLTSRIAMLARVQVEHELPERALEPRQTLLQHDEARARELRGGLEIHLAERFAELEMLLGRERVIALRAELVVLDIAVLVLAVRHLGERQVGNCGERLLELGGRRPSRPPPWPGSRPSARRPRPSASRRRPRPSSSSPRRSPSRPRCGAPAPCSSLPMIARRRSSSASRRVDSAGEPAPRQRRVEGVGIVANPFDVVHGVPPARHGWPDKTCEATPSSNGRPGHDESKLSAGVAYATAHSAGLLAEPARRRIGALSPASRPSAPTRSSPRRAAPAAPQATTGRARRAG